MGALGIGLIIFVDNPWVAGLSVLLWGLGASLGFPLTISAASDTGPDAPKRVSVVAITGYLAFLVGPPLLGFLGELRPAQRHDGGAGTRAGRGHRRPRGSEATI